jgi:hypothetical protein
MDAQSIALRAAITAAVNTGKSLQGNNELTEAEILDLVAKANENGVTDGEITVWMELANAGSHVDMPSQVGADGSFQVIYYGGKAENAVTDFLCANAARVPAGLSEVCS